MKNEKRITLVSLTILALLLTGFTWAYWNNANINEAVLSAHSNTIQVGEGSTTEITTTVNLTDNNKSLPLVPTKYVDADSTSEIVLKFDAKWATDSKTIDGAKGLLNVSGLKMHVEGFTEEELKEMFSVEIVKGQQEMTLKGTEATAKDAVQLKIVFHTEPKNKEIYDKIELKPMKVSFNVDVNEQ
ncbi:hypothetical protein ERUR111494_06305 [Erysipelothrix urinaevulpis]|uniref:hypothetical protein n=1 Tax=Erysipelothrix urinaevulpis TaxID=2683717 RepID=UPI00135AC165|nr:hypothetical protein [Erysipelothrix urinaevulpis]